MTDIQKPTQTIRIDAVYIAEQFARIGVTLDYLKEAMEKQSRREDAQDKYIEQLSKDIAEMKADIRSLKEAKPAKVSPFVAITAIVAAAGFVLSLLNQLYGSAQ
jgi:hypothetical protein